MDLDCSGLLFQTNIAPSPIPLAPQHPVEEDEDSNNDAGLGVEDEEETESDIVLPRPTGEQRSKGNQDRDAAWEGAARGTKRPISPSRGAPMKQRKTLSTLGGRKVSASTDVSKGSAQASPVAVAPPRKALKTARK